MFMPRIGIWRAPPLQATPSALTTVSRDCRFVPKQERSNRVLRQLTELWARSARSARLLSAKVQYETYETEQVKAGEG